MKNRNSFLSKLKFLAKKYGPVLVTLDAALTLIIRIRELFARRKLT